MCFTVFEGVLETYLLAMLGYYLTNQPTKQTQISKPPQVELFSLAFHEELSTLKICCFVHRLVIPWYFNAYVYKNMQC